MNKEFYEYLNEHLNNRCKNKYYTEEKLSDVDCLVNKIEPSDCQKELLHKLRKIALAREIGPIVVPKESFEDEEHNLVSTDKRYFGLPKHVETIADKIAL